MINTQSANLSQMPLGFTQISTSNKQNKDGSRTHYSRTGIGSAVV